MPKIWEVALASRNMHKTGISHVKINKKFQSKTYPLGAQKNCLIETILLSTHNICFGGEIRKSIFCYALLTKGLHMIWPCVPLLWQVI